MTEGSEGLKLQNDVGDSIDNVVDDMLLALDEWGP